MIILPAIDIQNGECVRLYQGDFSTAHKVADSPQETAAQFRKAGAAWVHMVDLDGAKEARAKNTALFLEIAKHSGLKVELGGGIRTLETVETYLESGISRVILGSAAVKNPELVEQAVKRFGERGRDRRKKRDGRNRGLVGHQRSPLSGTGQADGGNRRPVPDLYRYLPGRCALRG